MCEVAPCSSIIQLRIQLVGICNETRDFFPIFSSGYGFIFVNVEKETFISIAPSMPLFFVKTLVLSQKEKASLEGAGV